MYRHAPGLRLARRLLAAGGAAAALVLYSPAPSLAQESGSQIVNRAHARYVDANGNGGDVDGSATVVRGGNSGGGGGGGGGGQPGLPALRIFKRARVEQVGPGDTLQYTIVLVNTGSAAAPAPVMTDTLPIGSAYIPGSLQVIWPSGAPVFGVTSAVPLSVLRATGADLQPGDSAVLTYSVAVGSAAGGAIRNLAWVHSGEGQDSASATTPVLSPHVWLNKTVVGATQATVGGTLTFRLAWRNLSIAQSVRDAVLADTLPPELELVSADRLPAVATVGRSQVLTWHLGTLAPAQGDSLTLVTRVRAHPSDGRLVNLGVVEGGNIAAVAAVAAAVVGEAVPLRLEKQAGVIEAGLGDVVPYLLKVTRSDASAPGAFAVRDLLPPGTRLVAGSVQAADSFRVTGRELVLWAHGSAQLRYALGIVSPDGGQTLENRAVAESADGALSDTAVATVRLRLGFELQSRVILGKVWIDDNADGRQQPGEKGLANVEVWSEDGQAVRTDADGRFSFRDMATGSHLLRLDTLGLSREHRLTGDPITTVRLDGWTTPYVSFRLLPRPAGEGAIPTDVPAHGGATPSKDGTGGADAPGKGVPGRPGRPAARAFGRALVAPLREERDREEEEARAALLGPVVRITSPEDGAVVTSNKLYVGVRGENGAPVRLYDGDKQIGEERLRPDGRMDFVAVEITPGPHRLRVWMRNSWDQEVWDSVAVHRSVTPAKVEVPQDQPVLHAESRDPIVVSARVLDPWGVPLPGAVVTLVARGAEIAANDFDRSSLGLQLAADEDGVLSIPLRPGTVVGPGEVRLKAEKAEGRLQLRILPTVHPLVALGSAQVGVGAAPDPFGALTVRGSLTGALAVSVSVDSRRTRSRDDAFLRDYDPLGLATFPTFGDNSQRRALAGVTQKVSARVERGYDWMEMGDIQLAPFSGGKLSLYQRSLSGVAGRVSSGPLSFTGFASPTDQALTQVQLRGEGSSGPYYLGAGLRPGTERIAIETRATENAARVLARQELVRYVDYRIDYESGAVLLEHMLPAADAAGNPVFLVAAAEQRSGGSTHVVSGGRVELDAGRFLPLAATDSASVYVSGVREPAQGVGAGTGQDLVGAGARLRAAGLELDGETFQAMRSDTTARASRLGLGWHVAGDRARLNADWTTIGPGFGNGVDPRLASGLEEVKLGGDLRVGGATRLSLTHERQRFDAFGVQRRNTTAKLTQPLRTATLTAELAEATDQQGGLQPLSYSSLVGRLRLSTPLLELWSDGTHGLDPATGEARAMARPDQMGFGAALKFSKSVRLEATQRWVSPGDSAHYGITSLNLKAQSLFGGDVWGGLERADGEGSTVSTVFGWNPRLSLRGGWQADARLERRVGLSRAPIVDPMRALPFAQAEPDRWAAGAGLQYQPRDTSLHLSLRGELQGGQDVRGNRLEVAGEMPIGRSAALLTRHDWTQDRRNIGTGPSWSRRDRSLLGFAFRPVDSEALNLLAKVEWRRDVNPLSIGLLQSTGSDRRTIGMLDAIWSAAAGTELGLRYAVRAADVTNATVGGATTGTTHFLGARADQRLSRLFALRLDGHVLGDGDGSFRANFAPAFVSILADRLELQAGYRLGNLRDPDFFDQRESGLFATLSLRFTESAGSGVARYWRDRVAQDR